MKVAEARSGGDEDSTIWHVGPRGKVEVDKEALAAFVRTIYGGSSDELESKLQASLKIKGRNPVGVPETVDEEAEEAPPDGDPGPSTRRRVRRRQTEAEDEESE